MTATFKMEFDGDDASKGVKKFGDDVDAAGKKAASAGQDVGKAADAINDVGDEAKAAASKASSLEGEIDDLSGSAKKAESAVESFSVSTDQMGKKMDAAADKAEHLARAQAKVASGSHGAAKGINTLKDGAGGLDAVFSALGFGSMAQYAGQVERLTVGAKDLSEATGGMKNAFMKIAIPLAATYAIYKSMETVFNSTLELVPEVRVQWEGLTESIGDYIETGRKLLNDYGFLNDESEELKKKNEELKKSFDDNNKALAEAQAKINPVTDAIKGLNDEIARGREQEKIDVEVQGVESVQDAEKQIADMMAKLDEIKSRPAPTVDAANQQAAELEGLWKEYEPRVRALEERRKQIQQDIKQRAAAEAQAAEAKKKQDEDAAKRADEEHKKELERIKKESDAKQKAADDQIKKDIDAAKKARDNRMDELAKTKEVTQTKIEGIQQVEQAQQQAEQPNKYGEGEAPTAYIDNTQAYAGAVNPFSDIQTDFRGNENSYQAYDTAAEQLNGRDASPGGNDKGAQRKVVREAVDEQLRQHEAEFVAGLKKKYGLRDDQAGSFDDAVESIRDTGKDFGLNDDIKSFRKQQREVESYERRNYQKAAAGKDTGEDIGTQEDRQGELVDVGQRLLEETQNTGKARQQMIDDHIQTTRQTAEIVAEDRVAIAKNAQEIAAIKQMLQRIGQANQQIRGMRSIAPSRDTSIVRSL